MASDFSARINIKMDNSDFVKGAEEVEKKLDDVQKKTEKADESVKKVGKGSSSEYEQYDAAKITEFINKSAQANDTDRSSAQEIAEQERLEQIRANAVVSNQNLVDLLKEQEAVTARIADLKKAGVTDGYKEYDEQKERLAQINEEIKNIKNGFSQTANSGKKCFGSLQKGTKNTNGLLATMTSRLKGIALSLLVFNWISKGFNALVSVMKEGFQNLAQYSKDYNNAMSGMKSKAAELKNSFAAAFEPIATAIIPYITQLISWLNEAMVWVAKFQAIISGKSTYTKAKKQVVDYAKSLKTASDSAKGALASFDEINVLSKEGTSSTAGGEATGADAFETVSVTEEDVQMFDRIKEILMVISGILLAIGVAMAVFGAGGPMATFFSALLLIAGLLEFIVSYMDAWANGISFENLTGMLVGLLAIIIAIYMLFGPFAAGIAAIAGGIALVVLAIKDIVNNGFNMRNCILLVIGVVAALIGIFMAFGSTAAIIVGAVVAVIAILAGMIAIAGNGEEAIATLKSMCKNFADFFKKIFAGDIEGAMESLKLVGKDFANMFLIIVESVINAFIKGLNWLIDAINSIKFEVPDWVPVIGGYKFEGLNLQHKEEKKLPRLGTGCITNGPTKAVIGEAGREAVLPLENNTEWMDVLADKIGSDRPVVIRFEGSLAELGRILKPVIDTENSRVGASLAQI